MPTDRDLTRRQFLRSSLAYAALPIVPVAQHGAIRPAVEVPDLPLVLQNESASTLLALTRQHVTALQLMFTHCTTTCPMQGAIFESVQRLACQPADGAATPCPIQLVSLSVDPANDTPQAMSAWLGQFHAGPAPPWIGAVPRRDDVEAVRAFFGAGRKVLDPHSTQTQIIDRNGRLIWRTYELPSPEEIVAVLRRAAAPVQPK